MNCGAKKPEKKMQYRCSRCGWEPADPENPPKFCPECGDPFGTGGCSINRKERVVRSKMRG